MKAGNDLLTAASARHKKEPQAEYALGVLECCLNLGLLGRAAGCRGMGEPPGWPNEREIGAGLADATRITV